LTLRRDRRILPVGPGKRIKVTPEQEDTIRRLKIEGKKVAAIARAVGLSRPTIYAVLRGGERTPT
jgi:DNA invertase Pin-like site-specific DNA recombinase